MWGRAETSVCHQYAVTAGLRAAWSGGLGTTAVVAPAVQRPPLQLLQLIYIKLSALRFIVNLVVLDCIQ